MREEIERATAVLIGKPLWGCGRAANLATFAFGERIKTVDFFGKPTEVGEYALHVQCAWHIGRGEEVIVGSRDIYYPADYQSEDEEIPPDFDWDKHPNRRDRLLRSLFEDGARSFTVQRVEVRLAGSLRLSLSDGFYLDVFPDDSLGREHWRLFMPRTEERHFVVTGRGIET